MSAITNPAVQGPFNFESIVYAAENLQYGGDSLGLEQYSVYESPTLQFTTRKIDISPFAEFDLSVEWPFPNTAVPINGLACVPDGAGPFPVALFAHGNHNPFEHSTPGYLYLCELLASYGIITATIDVNFLNGANQGENDGRAIVQLEHIKQFLIWNETAGHPLHGKVDSSKIIIAGHSRGGEAVGHASLFNRLEVIQPDAVTPPIPLDGTRGLGPYRFSLKAAVAIAPTDKQYVPLDGPTRALDNYFILHGGRDGDVLNFPGYQMFDRTHAVNLAHPEAPAGGFKALLWIQGANHNFFNSVWQQESSQTITRPEQELIARVYISAIAQAVLQGHAEYLEVHKNHRFGIDKGWLQPAITLVSGFQDAERLYVQHSEEAGSTLHVSAPVTGSVDAAGLTARKMSFNLGPTRHLFQETKGVKIRWNANGSAYRIKFASNGFDAHGFSAIALNVGQSFEAPNRTGVDQDFTLSFSDGTGRAEFAVSSINRLVFPSPPVETEPKTILQTIRIPLSLLEESGLDIRRLSEISFIFNRIPRGIIYLDNIQFTK